MKILVIGISGMLGTMVFNYFRKHTNYEVAGTLRKKNASFTDAQIYEFDAQKESVEKDLETILKDFSADYIINCIGIIKPYCKDTDPQGTLTAIQVNALFPHILAKKAQEINPNSKIIQIATDCVYSGQTAFSDENTPHDAWDVYGKTKSLGEVRLPNFLNIRCSIIGHELKGNLSLLEWFLSNPPKSHLKGFAHHHWNGITTLQFAQFCEEIIKNKRFEDFRKLNHVLHYIVNEAVNKYELLTIFQEVYQTDFFIEKVSDIGQPIDRTISSVYLPTNIQSMKKAIQDLKNYQEKYPFA